MNIEEAKSQCVDLVSLVSDLTRNIFQKDSDPGPRIQWGITGRYGPLHIENLPGREGRSLCGKGLVVRDVSRKKELDGMRRERHPCRECFLTLSVIRDHGGKPGLLPRELLGYYRKTRNRDYEASSP